ncbi:MAG: hypothetical protein R6X10_06160, partial [Desulfobacterales bacterium]
MKKLFCHIIVAVFFMPFAYALEVGNHREMNEYIAMHNFTLIDFSLGACLKDKLNFKDGATEIINSNEVFRWLGEGGIQEDEPDYAIPYVRSLNHFHDPLTNEGYLSAKASSVLWAQRPMGEQYFGYYSWHDVRNDFYLALTSSENDDQEEYFAHMFRGLGQLMHLVEDASVPEHTRDDFHYFRNPYEEWVKANVIRAEGGNITINGDPLIIDSNAYFFSPDLLSQMPGDFAGAEVPIANLMDTNEYVLPVPDPGVTFFPGDEFSTIGLSEYTNANFLSADTMFKDYPYPKPEHCEIRLENPPDDGLPDLDRKYLSSTNGHPGEPVEHLAVVSYIDFYRKQYFPQISNEFLPVGLDPECHKEYAQKLIPRAIGYAAGLLKYFFRGVIEVKHVFPNVDGNGSITGMSVEVRNSTPLPNDQIELMVGGSLSFAYQYTAAGSSAPIFHAIENVYIVDNSYNPINSGFVPMQINFSEPIPPGADDISITIVYKGILGNEADAVAAKTIALTSRIAFYHQAGGPPNVSNIYTIFPDGTGETPITNNSDNLPYKFSPSWSTDGRMLAFDASYPLTSYNPNIIVLDMTSDQPYPDNIVTILDSSEGETLYADTMPSISPDGTKIVAVRREIVNGNELALFSQMVIFTIDDGSWTLLDETWPAVEMPRWSPIEDKILYNVNAVKINVINADGTGRTTLIETQCPCPDDFPIHTHPNWSQDGQKVVYIEGMYYPDTEIRTYDGIRIMDSDGTNNQLFYNCSSFNCYFPSLSPDGGKVVFSTSVDLYTYDGNELAPIITDRYEIHTPVWSRLYY